MTEPTLLQFAVSSCPPTDWLPINDEFHSLIALVHFALASNKIGVEEAGKLFFWAPLKSPTTPCTISYAPLNKVNIDLV